jgi:hypothetical protein
VRTKLPIALAVATASVSAAVALAATPASTSLTIKGPNGDFHGRIDSPKLGKCVDGRLVNVYKQKGSKQQPSTDQPIGADTAERHGDHGVWSIGNSGFKKGRFYARAPKKNGCKAGASKTIKIGPASTKVTIAGENGDYHGTVSSSKAACTDQREVTVYKQTGAQQVRSADQPIGSDTSDHGEWSIGNSGFKNGRFYAYVARTDDCRSAFSQTIER